MALTPYPSLDTLPEVIANGGKVPARSIDVFATRAVYASSIPGVLLDCNLSTGLTAGGGTPTDNAAKINAVLATATASNPIHLIIDGGSAIGSPIVIPTTGNVRISGHGWDSGFFVLSGSNCNAIQNVPDTDLAVVKAWNPPAYFSETPPGPSNIVIENLRINGNRGVYPTGNVSATNNTDGSVGSYSGIYGAPVYSPDARGVYTSGGSWFNGIMLLAAQNVHISNVWVYNAPANHIMLFHCVDVWIDRCKIECADPTVQGNQDGVHCNGGCSRIYITNTYFRTGDDTVAYNIGEGDAADGDGLFVHNCYYDNCLTGGRVHCLGAHTRRVIFSNITGTVQWWGLQVGVEQVDWVNPEGHHSITCRDMELAVAGSIGGDASMFLLSHPIGHIEIDHCKMIEPAMAVPMVRVGSVEGAHPVSSSIKLRDCSIHRNHVGNAAAWLLEGTGGSLGSLEIEGFRVTEEVNQTYTDIGTLINLGHLTVSHLSIDAEARGVGTVLSIPSTATVGDVVIKDLVHQSNAALPTAYSIIAAGSTVPISVGRYTGSNVAGLASGTVTLTGPGIAGLTLADSLVGNGWAYLSRDHSGVPAVKLGGLVNTYTLGATSTLAAGTATAGSATATTAAATATDASGGTPPYTYQWFRSTTQGVLGAAASGQTSLTLADTGLTAGTSYYYTLRYTDAASAHVDSNQIAMLTTGGAIHAHSAGLFDGLANSDLGTPLGVASAAALQAGSAWTIGAYFRPTNQAVLTSFLQPIISKWGGSTASNEYILYVTNSNQLANISVSNGTTQFDKHGTTVLSLNVGYWLAATYDGTDLHLFVNGVEEGSGVAASVAATSAGFEIGAVAAGTAAWAVSGDVTQVYKYPFALTPAQLVWMYNGGSGRGSAEILAQPGLTTPDILVCFENSGNLGLDSGPHGYNMANVYSVGPTQATGPG